MVTILAKTRWYYQLRWKLFFAFLATSLVPLMLFYNVITVSTEDYFKGDMENKLRTTANIIADNVAKSGYLSSVSNHGQMFLELEARSKESDCRVLIFDSKCVVIADTNGTETGHTLLVPEVISTIQKKSTAELRKDEKSLYVSVPIFNSQSEKMGAVLLVGSAQEIYDAVGGIQQKLLLFSVITVLIFIVLVFFLSQVMIDPLNDILKTVRRVTEGYMGQRITIKGHDEYSLLGHAFNDMTDKLEQVEKTREEFVSNVSHELKTPLSSIKVLSESILLQENIPAEMYREFLQDINSEIDRMTNIVNDLLTLVKLNQREQVLNIKTMNVNKMVQDVLKRLYPLALKRNIELLYEDVKEISIEADEMKLSLAISNLVENGIKYTKSGGWVKVTIDADHQNAYIIVKDTGIGINEEEQSKIFNRFYRVDKTRDRETGGTGLGLSITHSTVLLHNGSIRLTSKDNEGSVFFVRIPIVFTEDQVKVK